MGTRAKGNRNQRKAIEYYEMAGFTVSKAEQGGKFNTEKDLFGLFDLVAVKGSCVHFIQVTTNRPHTHAAYKTFAEKHAYTNIHIVQMVWYDRRGWCIFDYKKNGTMDKKDLRK